MYDDLIVSAAARYGVPVPWIQAVIQVESAWKADAYRAEPAINDASYGLMQLLLKTAQGLGFTGLPAELYDPAQNIDLGAKLLGQLRAKYGDNFQRVYSAYNSGRPDLYLTSAQVADHVARAVSALTNYVNAALGEITGNPEGSFVVVLLAGFLLYSWMVRKR